jgi:hypothetical protein
MSNRRRDDDSGEIDPPGRKPMPAGLIVALVVIIPLVVIAVIGMVILQTKVEEKAKQDDPATKIWSRDEFRAAVMGKSQAEVIKAVGRPDSTSDTPSGRPIRWYFSQRVLNPATQKPDSAWLHFGDDDRVDRVDW